jgi:LytTr DNA-binding domain
MSKWRIVAARGQTAVARDKRNAPFAAALEFRMPSTPPPAWLQHYLHHHRVYEALLAIGVVAISAAANVGVELIESHRAGSALPAWEPITWEVSSSVVALALLPLILAFDRRQPMLWNNLHITLPRHLLGSIVFCLLHVSAMVGIRKIVYSARGDYYDFGDVPIEVFYEYLKDVRSYFMALAIVYSYRYILLRLQGEARVLAESETEPAPNPLDTMRPQRFLVRKLGKEFLVAATDVERLEAQGNYVNLHMRGRAYPLRSTMTAIEALLDPAKFVRVHRSHIVNLEYLTEIEPLDTGDARLKLRDGSVVPCSRTFRATLRERGGALA